MSLDTNFNQSPYYDDYSEDKNFHRVLFRPGVAVQARELTQLQTILQNQIERFGDNIYHIGTIIKGCSFTYDSSYKYVKIRDNQVDGQQALPSLYANTFVVDGNGLRADVVNSTEGLESQSPDLGTLYLKYLNVGNAGQKVFTPGSTLTSYSKTYPLEEVIVVDGGTLYTNNDTVLITANTSGNGAVANVITFSNGSIRTILVTEGGADYRIAPTVSITSNTGSGAILTAKNFIAQIVIANNSFTEPTGNSYAAKVSEGVIYQKGFFVRVDPQEVIVSKYTRSPNNAVLGFDIVESIVNSSIDTTLLDNASGFTNDQAPGANRLKLSPVLTVLTREQAAANSKFFSIIEYENGNIVRDRTETQFNSINTELSRRTYEESGNYVTKSFAINSEAISSNNSHLNVVIGAGIGYVEGARVELNDAVRTPLMKGTTEKTDLTQTISTAYGNYVLVNNLVGNFNIKNGETVSLRSVQGNELTDNLGGTPAIPGVEIGQARVKSLVYDSGVPGSPLAEYRMYLFDIQMSAGYSFKSVRAIAVTSTGVCDPVLVGGNAVLRDINFDTLVFSSGAFAVKNFANEQYIYRTQSNTTFGTDGTFQINLTGSGEEWPYTPNANLNSVQERDFIVVPGTTLVSANNKTGTVVTSGANTVVGTGTAFTTDYSAGQYIKVGGTNAVRITRVANNTFLETANTISATTANVHTLAYPAFAPISGISSTINVDVTGKIATYTLGHSLTGTGTVSVYHDVLVDDVAPKTKTLVQDVYVKISNTAVTAELNGPWGLGIPDVLRITGVYLGTGTTYTATGINYVKEFVLDNGQRENYYGLASIAVRPGSKVDMADKNILVKMDVFTHSTGKYISTESYPIDDISTVLPTGKIRTQDVPVYTSTIQGKSISLRDAIDFRPLASNTAVLTSVIADATVSPTSTITLGSTAKFFPSPDAEFQGDIVSYLGRKDLVTIDTWGRVRTIAGVPSKNPLAPAVPQGAMALGTVSVPPFPSLSAKEAADAKRPDYAVLVTPTQQKGYTMKDIHDIAERVNRLEYYASLNTLEQETKNLTIPSSANGALERFKNGFFVDPFNDYSISNLDDAEYNALVDTQNTTLRPLQEQTRIALRPVSFLSSNVTTKGDYAMLNYVQKSVASQISATKFRSLVDKYWMWSGKAASFPAFDNYFDVTSKPVNVTIDTSSAVSSLAAAINENLARTSTVVNQNSTTSNPVLIGTRTTTRGMADVTTQTFQQSTTRTTTTSSTQITGGVPVTTTQRVGDFITDLSIRPYIRAQQLKVFVNGLRPGARHYVFFDKDPVAAKCAPANVPVNDQQITEDSFVRTGKYGDALIASSKGELAFFFTLDANKYFVGDREILVIDVDDLDSVESSSSSAITRFVAYNYGAESSSLSISTKSTTGFDTQTITSSSASTTRNTFERSTTTMNVDWRGQFGGGGGNGGGGDPISQTFKLKSTKGNDGYFLTSVDLYFKEKDADLGVNVEIREVNAGVPTAKPLTQSRVWLPSSAVGVSDTASAATRFTFATPVYIKADAEYAIVAYPDGLSPNYRIWSAKVGAADIANASYINNKNWGDGTLFYSTSGSTWTAVQDEDLKFELRVAEFTALSGTVGMTNDDYEFLEANTTSGAFIGGELVAQLRNSYSNGTVSTVESSDTVTGTGTNFTSLSVGDTLALLYGSGAVMANAYFNTSGTAVSNSFGTSSLSVEFEPGDFVRFANGTVGEIRQVVSVTNASSMVLDAPLTVAAANVRAFKVAVEFDVAKINSITSNTVLKIDRYGRNNAVASFQKTVSGVVEQYQPAENRLYLNKSNAANSNFLFAAANSTYLGTLVGDISQAKAKLISVKNININYLSPVISKIVLPGTTVDLNVTLTRESSGALVTDSYKFGNKNVVDFEGVIKSTSNEINGTAITKSLHVVTPITSSYSSISPIIDVSPVALVTGLNVVNNTLSGETGRYGAAVAKYISKRIVLAEGLDAEDALVYVTAYKPAGTEVAVYAKFLNGSDSDTFESKDWTRLEQETAVTYSSSVDTSDYREFKYVIPMSTPSTVLVGVASGYTANGTINGIGTAFNTALAVGDFVKIVRSDADTDYVLRRVTAIASATSMTLDSALPFDVNGATVERVAQKGAAFKYNQNSNVVRYHNKQNAAFDGYKTMAVKIVLLSPNSFQVPILNDVRAICATV